MILRKFVFVLTFFLAACQISPKDELIDGSIQEKNIYVEDDKIGLLAIESKPARYFLKLAFLCEPEFTDTYKKRTEHLVNQTIYVSFYSNLDKFLVRKAMFFNKKIVAYAELTKSIFDKTNQINLQIKNRTLTFKKDQFDRPILLPDSVCNK